MIGKESIGKFEISMDNCVIINKIKEVSYQIEELRHLAFLNAYDIKDNTTVSTLIFFHPKWLYRKTTLLIDLMSIQGV